AIRRRRRTGTRFQRAAGFPRTAPGKEACPALAASPAQNRVSAPRGNSPRRGWEPAGLQVLAGPRAVAAAAGATPAGDDREPATLPALSKSSPVRAGTG